MPNNHMHLTTVIYGTDQNTQESQLMRDKSKCHENKKCSSGLKLNWERIQAINPGA